MSAQEDKEHVRPFAIASPSPSIYAEEDPSKWQPYRRKLHNRSIILCSGCCVAVLAIIGVVLLVVALTVYKVHEPTTTMDSFTIKQMHIAPPAINMTLVADVSVENRNVAMFHFYYSKTTLHYGDALVAEAYGPQGKVPAHETIRMNMTVDVFVPEFPGDLRSGALGLHCATKIGGYVKIFGIFRHDVVALMKCTMNVALANESILNRECRQHVSE